MQKLGRVLIAVLVLAGILFGGQAVYRWYEDRPSTDPVSVAFRRIRAGNCLTSVLLPEPKSWSPTVPKTVDCDHPEAYTYVQGVTADMTGCDSSKGSMTWSNNSKSKANLRVLCLKRQIRVGECIAAKRYVEIRSVSDEEMWYPYACGTAARGGRHAVARHEGAPRVLREPLRVRDSS